MALIERRRGSLTGFGALAANHFKCEPITMQKRGPYIVYAALALLVLCVVSAMSYLQTYVPVRAMERASLGAPLSKQQIDSRRQAAMGTVAIAGATTQ
ncbi:hypothetical protein [Sphingomonas sp. TZW2008]|uniref:hypothetical protein n=1 Tax=Sphingomonas sp. TZW2008 TaxID=1917973 RepID=UPI000A26C363|nr:hypothetical protein [Sphingomonas sp. TZW2008]